MILTGAFPAFLTLVLSATAQAHQESDFFYSQQRPLGQQRLMQDGVDISHEPWAQKYGLQPDIGYTGPLSFSHVPYTRCLEDGSVAFDIGLLGMPFDTTTSYRPGARFGPFGIRAGSRRQGLDRGSLAWGGVSPVEQGASILDCGDVCRVAFRTCGEHGQYDGY
ncbi:unnamed protein product [Mycena citricolor]|uniref:Agmatinase n=1 Tax=Mycena citricolor TaxID=2018698 RepID=A0AAD2GW95_9AGAR|nr:unnamed protein product [Mycena citricolor]